MGHPDLKMAGRGRINPNETIGSSNAVHLPVFCPNHVIKKRRSGGG